jgi:hypothetical protein
LKWPVVSKKTVDKLVNSKLIKNKIKLLDNKTKNQPKIEINKIKICSKLKEKKSNLVKIIKKIKKEKKQIINLNKTDKLLINKKLKKKKPKLEKKKQLIKK